MGIVIFIITEIEGYEYLQANIDALGLFYLCPTGHLTGTAAMLSELYCSIHEKICMVAGARFRSIEAVIVPKQDT